jgi:membrane-associated protease RseP (regulator of RpoE activity)
LPDNRAILRKIITTPTGDTITLSVWRQDHSSEATLKVQPWPHMMALRSKVLASPQDVALAQAQGCGLHLAMLTDATRQRFHLSNQPGVLIDKVAPGSEAETMGFQAGDVIEKVGDVAVTTPDEVAAQVPHGSAANGALVSVLVRGSSGTRWLTLYVGRVDVAQLVAGPDALSGARNAAARPRGNGATVKLGD